jgi:prepilin-type N-terminal cleavage/methylation domain-containing protein
MSKLRRPDRGFSLIELLMVVALIGTVAAIGIPVLRDVTASSKLSEASRLVERELQNARLKAVSTNRALRVRPNCPTTGYIRTVELLGTSADTASNRCLPTAYPFPAPDTDIITRPNFDGPVRVIPNGATVTSAAIEFRPDGTALEVVSGVSQNIVAPVTITITRQGQSKSVTINAAGKVEYVR